MIVKRRWTAWLFPLMACVVSAAVPHGLAAQEPLQGARPDSLDVAADTVRVPVEELPGLGRCGIVGHAVVASPADLARLRRYPQCAKAAFPPVAGRTLVGLSVWGDCNSWFRVEAFRSESRRELRVRLWILPGGCRAMAPRDVWYSLPALPAGWTVRFTHAVAPEETQPWPGWTMLRAVRDDGR